MKASLTFDDVLLVPKFSTVRSRKDVNTRRTFLGEEILPIISSNMSTVTNSAMAIAQAEYGSRGCLHRFQSIEENVKEFQEVMIHAGHPCYVSFGVGQKELERALALASAGATHFILDVAHGASIQAVEQSKLFRHLIKNAYLVVGNFATKQSIDDFKYHLGTDRVDSWKLGVGPGSGCITRVVTGVGVPSLSCLLECSKVEEPCIWDGGIKNSGDLSKALALGAKAVMIGRLFAGSNEANNEFVTYPPDRKVYKQYRGSASKESYLQQNKESEWRVPEGESYLVEPTGPVKDTLRSLEAGLRSSMSYLGAHNLEQFKGEWVQITSNGNEESRAHGQIQP